MVSDLVHVPAAERDRTLAAERALGIGTERQPFLWRELEPQPGRWRFAAYDAFVASAARAGIAVMPILVDPPGWASTQPRLAGSGHMGPPADDAVFAAFARRLVGRYGPRGAFWAAHPALPGMPVHSWQIWNEPNLPAYWEPRADARAYARLLAATAGAIHRGDPHAEVVGAGIPNSNQGIPFTTYVASLLRAGAARSFDSFAIHPYAADADATLTAVTAARRMLDDAGAGSAGLWVTELGWASGGPPSPFTKSPAGQARALADSLRALGRARTALKLRGVVIFNWRDIALAPGAHDFWGFHTGLETAAGMPKPAYGAVRAALADLGLGRG